MKHFLESIMDWIALASIGYFFAVNTAYLFLLSASAWALSLQAKKRPLLNYLNQNDSAFAPSISILAPAYNEEATVVESVKSFLMLEYPSFEIIVINDGSKDNTLQKLIENFSLEKINPIYDNSLSATEVRGAYQSQLHPQLKVIDKKMVVKLTPSMWGSVFHATISFAPWIQIHYSKKMLCLRWLRHF